MVTAAKTRRRGVTPDEPHPCRIQAGDLTEAVDLFVTAARSAPGTGEPDQLLRRAAPRSLGVQPASMMVEGGAGRGTE